MQLSLCIGNMAEAVTLELRAGLSKNRLTPPWLGLPARWPERKPWPARIRSSCHRAAAAEYDACGVTTINLLLHIYVPAEIKEKCLIEKCLIYVLIF